MSAELYRRSVDTEQIRVRGGDLEELASVLAKVAEEYEGGQWYTDGATLVIELPMGEQLVGGSDYLEE